jgi:hypothetical protein
MESHAFVGAAAPLFPCRPHNAKGPGEIPGPRGNDHCPALFSLPGKAYYQIACRDTLRISWCQVLSTIFTTLSGMGT